MNQYVTIKALAERTACSEKTIRLLIRKHQLPHHRLNPRGKIIVELKAFEEYMCSTRQEVQKDPLVTEILREFRDFATTVR